MFFVRFHFFAVCLCSVKPESIKRNVTMYKLRQAFQSDAFICRKVPGHVYTLIISNHCSNWTQLSGFNLHILSDWIDPLADTAIFTVTARSSYKRITAPHFICLCAKSQKFTVLDSNRCPTGSNPSFRRRGGVTA